MWVLWLVLFMAVVGYFIYRTDKKIKSKFEDKFNPHDWDLPRSVELTAEIKPQPVVAPVANVKLSYEKTSSVLNDVQRPIFTALQQALNGEYILLTNINAGDVLNVGASNNLLAVQVATKNIATKQFDFVVCEKTQLRAVCVIMLGDSLDPLLTSICEDAQLPLARFKVQASYDVAVIRASLFKALGVEQAEAISTNESVLDIVDEPEVKSPANKSELTESGIALELCPECSAVMLKRKAKNGAAAGKLFWICSTYPKCRGVLPIK
ncbi:hypothetical protein GCM10011613_33320 [Cellvibrio zantedeschiae]|uniref:DUF2726 domain-containing protein n=1 Tax=Cellvibrio zantedeschiae TaxID=1237077 RepID=A0ABQ3B981_9GAMM|nr:DUF2726 domain-containing protein [Cellvibrio zantedeschiae]GGY85733.1 hypothetical protein GCM10011613_33320 [Cellvibrio zantedeschiae]